jgi:hypothetical protein
LNRKQEKDLFKNNYLIFSHIENNLIEIINKKLDKKLLKDFLKKIKIALI